MEKYCIHCGEPTVPGNRFCLSCGASLENNEEELKIEQTVEKEVSKPEKKAMKKRKKSKNYIKAILITLGVFVVAFIALAVFLINALDAGFTASEFKGEYSGIMHIEEIEYGMGENPDELLAVVDSFELPIKARIIEDETYDGVFIILNLETLEEESRMNFSGEYDQIIGDFEDENGNKEFIQAIVNQDTDQITITGYYEYNSFDDSVKIVSKFEMTEQSELMKEDLTELYEGFNAAINEYFNGLIEDNTDAEEEFSNIESEEIYGYYPVSVDGEEDCYIIFSKGQAPENVNLPKVSFDLEGWAFVSIKGEPLIIQYTDEKNIYSINRYIKTDTGEYYIDGDRNIVKYVHEKMKIDDDGFYRPTYRIDVQSELPANIYEDDYLIILTGKIEDGRLIGDMTVNDLHTEESFTIEFESK